MLPSTGRYWMVSCRGYVSIQAQAGTTRRLEEPLDWIIFALELEYFKDYLLRISCSSGSMMHLINWLVVYFKSIKLRSTKFALLDLHLENSIQYNNKVFEGSSRFAVLGFRLTTSTGKPKLGKRRIKCKCVAFWVIFAAFWVIPVAFSGILESFFNRCWIMFASFSEHFVVILTPTR